MEQLQLHPSRSGVLLEPVSLEPVSAQTCLHVVYWADASGEQSFREFTATAARGEGTLPAKAWAEGAGLQELPHT